MSKWLAFFGLPIISWIFNVIIFMILASDPNQDIGNIFNWLSLIIISLIINLAYSIIGFIILRKQEKIIAYSLLVQFFIVASIIIGFLAFR